MTHSFSTAFFFTSILTLIICVLGIFGHLICLIVLLHKDTSSTSYKHLLQGLSFSDLFLLILSILRTLGSLEILNPGNHRFPTVIFFWDWICTSGTKYFTVAISLERFFVVAFPLKAHHLITPQRSKIFAATILGFIVTLACFSFAYESVISPKTFDMYTAIVLHFAPFIIVLLFNILIILALRHHRKIRESLTATDFDQVSATPMLVTVVVVFGVCYSFEFVRRVLNFEWKEYMNQYEYYDYAINHLADIFYVLNSSVNFVIYYLLGNSFKVVFLKVIDKLRLRCCFTLYLKYQSWNSSQVKLVHFSETSLSTV